jgi:hypothetical protein
VNDIEKPVLDERVTNSQLTCAATCLRKHEIQYLYKIRPAADAAPLRFGKSWHDFLDRRAKGASLETNIALIRAAYDLSTTGQSDRDEALAYERETLCVLGALYDWRWGDQDKTITVLASEEAFEVPVVNPETGRSSRNFRYAGKIDRRIRLSDGRDALMENKTTSDDLDPASDYWSRLRIDTQIARYVLAARHLGHAIDTVIYDVVRKPGMRPSSVALTDADGVKIVMDANGERVKTANGKAWRQTGDTAAGYTLQVRPETPEEWSARLHAAVSADPDRYFSRKEIPRTNDDLIEAQYDLWNATQMLASCDRDGRWYRNSSACIGFGRCAFLSLCSASWKPSDGTIPPGFVKLEDSHQELLP